MTLILIWTSVYKTRRRAAHSVKLCVSRNSAPIVPAIHEPTCGTRTIADDRAPRRVREAENFHANEAPGPP